MRKNLALLTLISLTAAVVTGCATMGTDMQARDTQKITHSVALWKAGVESGNWDKMMTLRYIMKGAVKPEFLKGAKVEISNPKITFVNEDHMTVAPVIISNGGEKITVQLTMLKEKGRFYVLFVDPIK
jgi:hypothetical protein